MIAAHGDGAALLAAVVAEPENLDARRIYADWLIEHGDVRGELIHTQCALEGMTVENRAALEAREEQLLLPHQRWFEATVKPYVEHAVTRRGLIEEIAIDAKRLCTHAARLFAEHPIRSLRVFVKNAAELARVAALPQLQRITELAIVGRSTPTNPGATLGLAATDMFRNLRRLRFEGVLDKAPAWKALFVEMTAPVLEALRFEWTAPSLVYELLGDAAILPTVRDIATRFSPEDSIRQAALRALARREGLVAVELVALHEDANAAAIDTLSSSRSIVELRFERCTLRPESIDALRAWNRLERVVFHADLPRSSS